MLKFFAFLGVFAVLSFFIGFSFGGALLFGVGAGTGAAIS